MNPKIKPVLAGALALAGGAVWVPQLVGANRVPEHLVQEDVGADGSPSEADAERAYPDVAASQEAGSSSLGLPEETPSHASVEPQASSADVQPMPQDDPLIQLEATLARAESLGHGASGLDLSDLLRSLDPGREAAPVAAKAAPGVEAVAALEAFAAEHPVRGTIAAGPRGLAVLGGQVVRVGHVLAGGVVLRDVGPGWVRLGLDGEELELRLEPFQARPRPLADGQIHFDGDLENPVATEPAPAGAETPEGGSQP